VHSNWEKVAAEVGVVAVVGVGCSCGVAAVVVLPPIVAVVVVSVVFNYR